MHKMEFRISGNQERLQLFFLLEVFLFDAKDQHGGGDGIPHDFPEFSSAATMIPVE